MGMIKRFEDFVKDLSLKIESKQKDVEKESKVKIDDEHKYLAGVKEVIEIVGLGKMKVKLDSGNSSLCALIVQDFKEDEEHDLDIDKEENQNDFVEDDEGNYFQIVTSQENGFEDYLEIDVGYDFNNQKHITVRPSVVLRSTVIIESDGNGSQTKPYVVK